MKDGALTATPVNQKEHNKEVKDNVRVWAPVIGLRAAARKFGVKEDTACWWSHKEHWKLPAVFAQTKATINAAKQAQSSAHAAHDDVLVEQSRDTMLYMSSAALKASYEAARLSGKDLLNKETAIALQAHNRTADTTHGWTESRRQQQQVAVAVQVVMPTEEENRIRKEEHKKLDEIAQLLRAKAAAKQHLVDPRGPGSTHAL